jgi:ribosomal protein L37E
MTEQPTQIRCSRCGKEGETRGTGNTALVPHGWEGSPSEPVCPGCQLAEWHPLCQSLLNEEGARVAAQTFEGKIVLEPAIAAMPQEEVTASEWDWCEYLDLSLAYLDPAQAPTEWTCPRCGGQVFILVHADYPLSNLRGTTFTAEIEKDED